jgi:hypothetical protein
LQASLEKRLSRGLVGVISYTFSKNVGALGFLNDQAAQPTKSVVDFDSPHVLVARAVYESPFGRGKQQSERAGHDSLVLQQLGAPTGRHDHDASDQRGGCA